MTSIARSHGPCNAPRKSGIVAADRRRRARRPRPCLKPRGRPPITEEGRPCPWVVTCITPSAREVRLPANFALPSCRERLPPAPCLCSPPCSPAPAGRRGRPVGHRHRRAGKPLEGAVVTVSVAGAAKVAPGRHDGPRWRSRTASSRRARCVVQAGTLGALPEPRHGPPPRLFVLAGQDVRAEALRRHAVGAGAVRQGRHRRPRLQHPRPHDAAGSSSSTRRTSPRPTPAARRRSRCPTASTWCASRIRSRPTARRRSSAACGRARRSPFGSRSRRTAEDASRSAPPSPPRAASSRGICTAASSPSSSACSCSCRRRASSRSATASRPTHGATSTPA